METILLGLASALSWGGGDFAGGLSSRKVGAYRAVFFAELVGIIFLVAALAIFPEALPTTHSLFVAACAGVVGTIGLVILYHAMSRGKMSLAAPLSALLAAALPVAVSALTQGLPGYNQVAGFGLAGIAIWLVSSDGHQRDHNARIADLWLPILAGLAFGGYFLLIHQSAQEGTLWPMIASRSAGTVIMLMILLARREKPDISGVGWPLVILNAGLDVGGNAFYVLASQTGRLDIAAVLSSLYPGITVLLAWLILKERINTAQKLGILTALAAIVLMTLEHL